MANQQPDRKKQANPEKEDRARKDMDRDRKGGKPTDRPSQEKVRT